MGSKVKRIALFLAACFIVFNTWPLFGVEVKLAEKIGFSQDAGSNPLETRGFCLTDDELFITPNQKNGDIEISEINSSRLELINVLRGKEFGLMEPTFCYYNKKEGRLGIVDFGKKQIVIFERTGRSEFTLVDEIPCIRLATDIQLFGKKGEERLLLSGYIPDENGTPYDLYEVKLADGQTTLLLPSWHKYGLKSNEEYKIEYRQNSGIRAKGLDSWFDVQGDDVYYTWSANYKIIKINIKSKALTFFGQKPRNYVEPSAEKLIPALNNRNKLMMETARQSMSYISKVFTTPEYVLVIFEGPFNQVNGLNFTLQLYDLNGKYLGETAIPGRPGDRMHFDKDKKILYSLSRNSANSGYIISKYTVSQ
ncbi:MAG TPA: hypothetical protein VK469_10300 [Candidatus Kapabacteria bacterium]|nr:hypothetical protein [Candidatus Kapabacteria bacterium]